MTGVGLLLDLGGLGLSRRSYMESFGFPGATVFDYLNPWSDLRIALDRILPRVMKAMRKEIQVSVSHFYSHLPCI